jgi:hypothetical protein
MLFQNWRIETLGVWSPGMITYTDNCYSSHRVRLDTVKLSVEFTDIHGTTHVAQTSCEYNRYHEGQAIAVRYLPNDPSHILIQAEIGGGQGVPLIVMTVIDAICIPLFALATIYAIRRARRAEATRAEATCQQLERRQTFRERKRQQRMDHQPMAMPRRYRRPSW